MIMGNNKFMTVNYLDKETEERIYNRLDAFNADRKDTLIEGCYFISVGAKCAMFTLWRWINPQNPKFGGCFRGNPSHYLRNLSTDLETAVEKAIEYVKNSRLTLDIDRDTNVKYNYQDSVFCFGKYKGEVIEDVAQKDIQYLIWLDRQSFGESGHSKTFLANIENVHAQVDFYFDTIAQKNRETCKSQFAGKSGDKLTNLALTIIKVELKHGYSFGYNDDARYISIIALDENENRFSLSFNAGTKNFRTTLDDKNNTIPAYAIGDVLNIASAKVSKTFESLGRKTTTINYIKMV